MHRTTLIKYAAIAWVLVLLFANFIACGSQMYQVSLHDDFNEERALKHNPQANDKESTLYGIHSTTGWKELPVRYKFGKNLNAEQRTHLVAAMKTWELAVGKKIFQIEGVHDNTGDNFRDLYSSLSDEINGHYLDDNWKKTKKPDYVLATTIWHNTASSGAISKADIRFNNQSYIIGDSLTQEATDEKEVVDMQSLALHEIGHLLGLAHVESEVDDLSIMNPTLYIGEGLISRNLSDGDIERIQTIYGCKKSSCDTAKAQNLIKKYQNQPPIDPLKAH